MFENTVGPLPLAGLDRRQIREIRFLATGAEIPLAGSWVCNNFPDIAFADLGPDPVLPDPVDTVLEVILED